MNSTHHRIQTLARRIQRDQTEFEILKQEIRRSRQSLDGVATVYRVRETRVKSHTRRGFTAVRITT